jgi:hypothetical protein
MRRNKTRIFIVSANTLSHTKPALNCWNHSPTLISFSDQLSLPLLHFYKPYQTQYPIQSQTHFTIFSPEPRTPTTWSISLSPTSNKKNTHQSIHQCSFLSYYLSPLLLEYRICFYWSAFAPLSNYHLIWDHSSKTLALLKLQKWTGQTRLIPFMRSIHNPKVVVHFYSPHTPDVPPFTLK